MGSDVTGAAGIGQRNKARLFGWKIIRKCYGSAGGGGISLPMFAKDGEAS